MVYKFVLLFALISTGFCDTNNYLERLEKLELKLNEKIAQDDNYEGRLKKLEELVKVLSLRSCEEYARFGITLDGYYNIDPDGPNMGKDPVVVFCRFHGGEDVYTEVMHDAEETTEIGNCQGDGCFERKVEYKAPPEQLESLIQLSERCVQEIIFDCLASPLRINGLDRGWWEDKNGNPQYFFDGNYSPDTHVCACNNTNSCAPADFETVCNCDANRPELLADAGKITAKSVLPITAFRYGPVEFDLQYAAITIKRLRCSGKNPIPDNKQEVSCNTLKRQGVYVSGIYTLWDPREQYPRVAHCQMDAGAAYDDPNLESQSIGHVDLATGPGQAYFHVVCHNCFDDGSNLIKAPLIITYDTVYTNYGGHLDTTTGEFKAPFKGVFKFSLNALHDNIDATNGQFRIQKNGENLNIIVQEWSYDSMLTFVWYAELNQGDSMRLFLSEGAFWKGTGIHFTGMSL